MSREVVYLMSGAAHCPYLLVSLMTLRQHYRGVVRVHAWPESIELVRMIAKDDRLSIEAVPRDPVYRGKREGNKSSNDQFLDKLLLLKTPGASVRVYLDADTIIYSPQAVDGLVTAAEDVGFCATQFNHWLSNGRVIRARLGRLKGKPPIVDAVVDQVMTTPYPSPNGGVLACRPESPVLPVWHSWAFAARTEFICDEAALHCMQVVMPDHMTIKTDGWWNASFKYWDEAANGMPFIYHGHGDCFARPEKSPKAVEHWGQLWRTAVELDMGNVNQWPSRHCDNKYLKPLFEGDSVRG